MAYPPRIMLEFVTLVRPLLAASEQQDVARIGQTGEITYLVEERITTAQLDILDSLMASMASGSRREFGVRRLQTQREALQPFIGRSLLKCGLQCATRRYEVFVDPRAESVVHVSGFEHFDAPPDLTRDASPAEQARWIFANPHDGSFGDGERVVDLLLAGSDVWDLSTEELELLAKGYNWCSQHAKSFEIAKVALARQPHNIEWCRLAGLYAWNAFGQDLARFLTACDRCIAEGQGPPAFWYLLKADAYIRLATGEHELEDYEWTPGEPIWHSELLHPAAEAIQGALACQPGLATDDASRGWVGDWNERFAAVVERPEFRHLQRESC